MEIFNQSVCYVTHLECVKDCHVDRVYFYYNDTPNPELNHENIESAIKKMETLSEGKEFDYYHIFTAGIAKGGYVIETDNHNFYNFCAESTTYNEYISYVEQGNVCHK